MLKTRMTETFGIKHPIQCGTMMGLSNADLVSAAANAGALACIAAAMFPTNEELSDEIKKTMDMTDQPFGVNVSLFPSLIPRPVEEMIETIVKSGVKIIETAGRNPAPYRELIADGGLKHLHKCARVRDAAKVDKIGVDAVSIVGTECGGHPSMEGVTSLVLIPQTVDACDGPVIAGGGFSDGRSLIVALALGADGVNMGTRFMATKECPLNQKVKDTMLELSENATVLVMQSIGNPSRVMKSPWTEKILEMESEGATLEELVPYISGKTSQEGWQVGNMDQGMFPLGQVVGRIHDIPTVEETIQAIVHEAKEVQGNIAKAF